MSHQVKGSAHYAAKLSEDKVRHLKTVQKVDDLSNIEIINIYCKKYRVSNIAIRNVLEGVTWKHITV